MPRLPILTSIVGIFRLVVMVAVKFASLIARCCELWGLANGQGVCCPACRADCLVCMHHMRKQASQPWALRVPPRMLCTCLLLNSGESRYITSHVLAPACRPYAMPDLGPAQHLYCSCLQDGKQGAASAGCGYGLRVAALL